MHKVSTPYFQLASMKSASGQFELQLAGLLLGTAIGDALGLPAEGLSPEKIRRRWGSDWKMRLFFGKSMTSDDTEHTLMIAQALLVHPDDPVAFQKAFAWKLRWWFVSLPAGVGLATAKASVKLWCGFPCSRSGIRSAGNGPAMRVAVIGAFFAHDRNKRQQFTAEATTITHVDVRAKIAALAVAEAAAWIVRNEKPFADFLPELLQLSDNDEWRAICQKLIDAYQSGVSVQEFANRLGLQRGITGYALHTVPMAIYAVARHPNNYRAALISVLSCGGDADTVGAIVGALAGAQVGKKGIPGEWMDNVWEWPRSLRFAEKIASRLAQAHAKGTVETQVPFFWPGIIPRNLLFLIIVLMHGFRRLLPPY